MREMIEREMTADEIFKSGKFPGRTYRAIAKQIHILKSGLIVPLNKKFIVPLIQPAPQVLHPEEIIKRYCSAFKGICETAELTREELERFRIIFMAAWKYTDIYAEYERLKQIEEQMEEIRRRLEALEAQSGAATKAE